MALNTFKSLWTYRNFIFNAVWRDFEVKYRNSLLGFAWAVINPLATITIYTLIFSEIMQARLPGVESKYGYGIFLCSGVLLWTLFFEIVTRSLNVFLENANLIKKVNFPKVCLPTITVLSSLINFSIVATLFTAFLALTGNLQGPAQFMFFISAAILALLATGIGVWLGILNIFVRDVGQFTSIILQFWFWLTPIVYPLNIIPDWLHAVITANPLTPLMIASQHAVLTGEWPNATDLAYPAILAVVMCVLGFTLFRRVAGEIVDQL